MMLPHAVFSGYTVACRDPVFQRGLRPQLLIPVEFVNIFLQRPRFSEGIETSATEL